MLMLKQDITRKAQVNKITSELKFNNGGGDNKKEYKVEAIRNNGVDRRESDNHVQGPYYLVSQERYQDEKNLWEPASAI